MTNAIELITAADLSAKWQDLVVAWIKFEEVSEFKSSQLGSKDRPQAIADWIRRARRVDYRPEIKNITAYEEDFRVWWISLQPAWRRVDSDWPQKGESKGDWEMLRRSGRNGLVSVVAALFFWGWASRNDGDAMKTWDIAVDDVLYALTQMI